jgi:ring-1,2-phenylacetyl-CoA epoxidase subunit PaaC
MATTSIRIAESPLMLLALSRADDALILGHRLSEWCGHAPMLEEELALANMGLDLIGQTRMLYALAAEIEGAGRDEDQFAYLRDAREWRNLLLVERPNGDFAHTMVRQFLYSAFSDLWWRATTRSTDGRFAAVAGKAEKECAYHLRHSTDWMIRLGDGTEESHRRTQAALAALWRYTGEMFEPAEPTLASAGIAVDPPSLRPAWDAAVNAVLTRATLERPADGWMETGGRAGRHTEALGHLLAELQHLPRSHPGAVW